LDPVNLVIRQTRADRREVPSLEVDDLGAADHAVALRTSAILVPDHRLGERTRLPPPKLVQHLPCGAAHRFPDWIQALRLRGTKTISATPFRGSDGLSAARAGVTRPFEGGPGGCRRRARAGGAV